MLDEYSVHSGARRAAGDPETRTHQAVEHHGQLVRTALAEYARTHPEEFAQACPSWTTRGTCRAKKLPEGCPYQQHKSRQRGVDDGSSPDDPIPDFRELLDDGEPSDDGELSDT